ncbi:MAG: hypothetical protein O7F12_08020 [Nitrospirae bacterium]|nr:hypothetical protein [Nitrospirota bacterium]
MAEAWACSTLMHSSTNKATAVIKQFIAKPSILKKPFEGIGKINALFGQIDIPNQKTSSTTPGQEGSSLHHHVRS